jgi:hypothetical protein
MRQQDRNHQNSAEAEDSIWVVLPIALIVVLTVGVMTMTVMRSFNFGPAIGDVVVFQPTKGSLSSDGLQRADVTAIIAEPGGPKAGVGLRTCVLNPTAMAVEGGSLVVERSVNAGRPMFQVHWAGHHTSPGATDCGSSADLLLPPNDLLDIAGAAGGFGIGHKVVISSATMNSAPAVID